MQSMKWEGLKPLKDTIKEIIGMNEDIVLEFEVLPLDYKVKDIMSPKFFISDTKLILSIDDMLEIYDLQSLEFFMVGGAPKFTLWEQVLEGRMSFTREDYPISEKREISDNWFRMGFREINGLPREFVFRQGYVSGKEYQTWAMYQTIKNLKENIDDIDVYQMIYGNFSKFDSNILLYFFVAFLIFLLLKLLLIPILPALIGTILDWTYGAVALVMLGWTVVSMNSNVVRYRGIYQKYLSQNTSSPSSTGVL